MNDAGGLGTTSASSILPDDWDELAPLLDRALDVPPADRAALLREMCDGNPDRLTSLERILAECDGELPLFQVGALDRFDQLADDDAELPPVLSNRYRIARRIACGGMARVYLARDLKHERDVAVKVIRPEVAASIGRELFHREIAIAARLRHPNIVPVYDSGEEAGVLYFVMPYESGRSLGEKIRGGPIGHPEVLRILRDVARALDYAHAQGVVHRDIKPDNVMLSEGTAVVTDFGISVALHAAQRTGPSPYSELESALGTPAYMSPEQAAGDHTSDHRADIYSFGCMAYELLCGRLPFEARSSAEMLEAHRHVTPQPVSALARNVSPAFASLIDRCLQKDPAGRPQQASEIVTAIDDGAPEPKATSKSAWIYLGAITTVSAAALALYFILSAREQPRDTGALLPIVVLPFTSTGGDQPGSPLARGFSDEIASSLVDVPWLRVMSRVGSSGYKPTDTDYRKTGLELGAKFIVTGSMRLIDDRVQVGVDLIDASDGSTRWAEHFDRPRNQLETERDEIVRETAAALQPLASQRFALHARAVPARPVNGEAYFLQVQAQQWLDRRGQSVKQSAEYFRRAIAIDSGYAKAYAGLSLSLALYPYFQNTPAAAVRSEVVKNARKALELDATLAQAHIALGLALQHDNKWDLAAAQFDSAVRLSPHDVEARVQYGRHLLFRGRTADALAQFQAARADDPASSLVLGWVAYTFFIAKKLDSARVLSDRAVKSNSLSLSSVTNAALMHLALGETKEARQLISMVPANFAVVNYVRVATGSPRTDLAGPGHTDSSNRPWMSNTTRAYILLGQHDTMGAVNAFEAATVAEEIWPSLLPVTDPLFDPVRGNPRFQLLLKRIGLNPKN